MSDTAQVVCAATTLTSSWATLGSAVTLLGSWGEPTNGGDLTLMLTHVKHASESSGYPMVRVRWTMINAAGSEVTNLDPLTNDTITESSGVATVTCDTAEMAITALTDSDGTTSYPLAITAPPWAGKLTLQAKQAGDTTNFGTLAAQLVGRI